MFEWLEGNDFNFNGENGFIKEFNPQTKKFIVENEDEEVISEIDLFESGITHNIDWFENWQEKIFTGLIRGEGKTTVEVYSTESGDNWPIDIYRHKTLLPTHEYSDEIILVSYVIVFAEEVKGEILTRRYQKYPGHVIEEQNDFNKWIEKQIITVEEFNNNEYFETSFSGIVISDTLCSEEEYGLLVDMFFEKYNGK